ncbi:MAG TPA: hypothetical protein VFG86_06300, partial [Chloroflexota bacterium]|nr:hypothetical protein [Chloroflexota bacterium]
MFKTNVQLLFVLIALATALMLAACAPSAPAAPTSAPPSAATSAPPAGATSAPTTVVSTGPKVLKMARNAEPGVFVPWLIDDNTALFTLLNVYDTLYRTT